MTFNKAVSLVNASTFESVSIFGKPDKTMTLPQQTDYASVTTEWLQLETATEIIGQMIAHYVAFIADERKQETPDRSMIEQAEELIKQFGQERKACYRSATRDAMIQKAYTEYAPFLKDINQ